MLPSNSENCYKWREFSGFRFDESNTNFLPHERTGMDLLWVRAFLSTFPLFDLVPFQPGFFLRNTGKKIKGVKRMISLYNIECEVEPLDEVPPPSEFCWPSCNHWNFLSFKAHFKIYVCSRKQELRSNIGIKFLNDQEDRVLRSGIHFLFIFLSLLNWFIYT